VLVLVGLRADVTVNRGMDLSHMMRRDSLLLV
jgi:hypothetical protein